MNRLQESLRNRLARAQSAYRLRALQARSRFAATGRQARYAYARLPWRQPRETVAEQNTWNLYMDAAWFGVASGVWGTYLSVLAVRLGASTQWLGVLAALPALVNMVWSIPSVRIIERQPHRMPLVIRQGLWMRLAWLAVAFVPLFVPDQISVYAIVFIAGLSTVPTATSNIAFTDLLADLVPPQDRARVISIRNVLLSATSTVTILIFGVVLDAIPMPMNYAVVFGASFACSMVSLLHVSRLVVTDEAVVAHIERPKHWITTSIRNAIAQVRKERAFVLFTASSVIFNWGVYFPSALYTIYRIRNLGASDAYIGALTTVGLVFTIFFFFYWGRVAPRWGNRRVLILSAFGMALFPILTGLSTTLPALMIPAVLGGIFTPGVNLAAFNELLAVSPTTNRPRFIALNTSLVNFAAFVAPLAGSYASTAMDIRLALYLSGALRIVGALAFVFLIGGGLRGLKSLTPTDWRRWPRESRHGAEPRGIGWQPLSVREGTDCQSVLRSQPGTCMYPQLYPLSIPGYMDTSPLLDYSESVIALQCTAHFVGSRTNRMLCNLYLT